MDAIKIIVKRPGKSPEVCQVENDLRAFQAIVEGHIEMTLVATDGPRRVYLVANEDGALAFNSHSEQRWRRRSPMPENFTIRGKTFRGPVFVLKTDINGRQVNLSDVEADQWMRFLANNSTEEAPPPVSDDHPEESLPQPSPGITDAHQILLLPDDSVDESGLPVSPERQISRLAEQVGYRYELVPVSNQDVYGLALTCISTQGYDFVVEDEDAMLLILDGKKKFLRVVEICGLDR